MEQRPVRLPFEPFARERLVMLLIGLSALTIVQFRNTQDQTRLSLTQAIAEHGDVTIERYGTPLDRARKGRHLYTDKAPGLSLIALPAVAVVRAGERVTGRPRARLIWESAPKLFFVRLVTVGSFLLLLAWLIGRTAEGLAPRTGAAAAVTASIGTMMAALSSVLFAHVAAACLGFAAFILLARGRNHLRYAAAGALAGGAVLMDYEAALLAAALGAYVLLRRDWTGAAAYALGGLPAAAILGIYDTVAFGSPLRLSYSYKVGAFADEQAHGFFGIGWPHFHSLEQTVAGDPGLLTSSPVLAAAAVGLVLLWRRGLRAEAGLAAAVVVLYLALEAGYFFPSGGISPGPRFFTPAIPFLLFGFPLAFAVRPRLVALLAAASVALSTRHALTWYGETYARWPKTVASELHAPRIFGVAFLVLASLAAVAVALWDARPLGGWSVSGSNR